MSLGVALAGASVAMPAFAQVEEIVVTATRRAEAVQDIPVNISAVGGTQIEQQGFDDLSELASYVPGLNVVDQGGRDGNRIVVRGLNAESIANSFGQENGGGTVATYVGEIPLYVDLRLNDLERVEVLLGPQGTLYGAGTMGGAIRYIPKKPDFDSTVFEARVDAFSYSEGRRRQLRYRVYVQRPYFRTICDSWLRRQAGRQGLHRLSVHCAGTRCVRAGPGL